jgi:hypothetical protein
MSHPMGTSNPYFTYTEITRRNNPLSFPGMYALDKKEDTLRPLSENIASLEEGRLFKKTVRTMQDAGTVYNSAHIPDIARIPLGEFDYIDEDGKAVSGFSNMVQRKLDTAHVGRFMEPGVYVPQLSQAVYAIKSPVTGRFTIIDGQHTVSGVAAAIKNKIMSFDGEWQDFCYPVLYVETDDLSFALRSFGLINGKGKMKITAYKELELSVFVVRVCGNTDDEDDVKVERKVTIAQNNGCYAMDPNSAMVGKPGTFTHISQFRSLSDKQIEMATAWHNKYFHYNNVDGALWFMFKYFDNAFSNAKIKITDEFLEEIAGMITNLFADYDQFHQDTHTAWNAWATARYGNVKANPWNDNAIAAMLLQIYKRLGGEHPVPQVSLDEYNNFAKGTSLIDFFSEEVTGLFVE